MDWTAVGTVATVIGLLFVAIQIRQSVTRQRSEDTRTCRQATLEYARGTMDLRYKNWGELPDDFDKAAVAEAIEAIVVGKDAHLRATVQEYLSVIETFCLGISLGIYDLDTAFQLYGGRIMAVAENYADFIATRREETGRKAMYVGIQELASELKALEHARAIKGLPVR